jgi:hypothetical protein
MMTGLNPTGICMCGCGQTTAVAKITQSCRGIRKGDHMRYVHGHQNRCLLPGHNGNLTRKQDYEVTESGCWQWLKSKDKDGYGLTRVAGSRKTRRAHRAYYERIVGPIPAGLTIDHLCLNTSCVNPAHMEVVTVGENTARANRRRGKAS